MENDVLESANGFHKPVPPCASGEGYPYAPENWPNAGDVWTWKVGNKITPTGYFVHRSLIVPKRLQKTPTRKIWLGSKLAVVRFLQSEIPDADIDAFFASFTWEIPAETGTVPQLKDKSSTQEATPGKKSTGKAKSVPRKQSTPKKEAEFGSQTVKQTRHSGSSNQGSTPEKEAEMGSQIRKRTRRSGSSSQVTTPKHEAELGSQTAKRTRKSAKPNQGSMPKSTPKNEEESGSLNMRRTRSSARTRLSEQDASFSMDLPLVESISAAGQISPAGAVLKTNDEPDLDVANFTEKDDADHSGSRRKHQDLNSQMNNKAEMTSEDVDSYLNSLDEILSQSLPEAPTLDSSLLPTEEDFGRARAELSSLLSQELSSLIASDKIPLVTSLSSMLRSDPDLNMEELSMLDLILEIPEASNHIQNAIQVKVDANKFFADLETNIALVSKLRSKYTLLKDKIAVLQAENATNSPTIQELDDQIAKLQARRDMLAKAVEENEEQIAELSCTQKRILNSLPKIVNEVQAANTEKSEWEVKQKEAAKQEVQILARFAPLEGFSFLH